MIYLFNVIFYQPVFNALIFLYDVLPWKDLGVITIILTIIIRIILWPLFTKSLKSQRELQEIQPLVKKIQEQYKNDKAKQSQAMMELYKERKVNPFSGIFALIIQFPILIALYRVFVSGFTTAVIHQNLYGFVSAPAAINSNFFGIVDLLKPSIIITLIAVAVQTIQSLYAMPTPKAHSGDSKFHMFDFTKKPFIIMISAVTFFVLWRLPAVLSLYIFASFLVGIIQQYIVNHSLEKAQHPDSTVSPPKLDRPFLDKQGAESKI